MTVTSGFFDSLDSDRLYSAAQMGSIFNGLITNGIYSEYLNAFAPVANDTMFVTIGSGRAWFDETWTYNDADVQIEIAAAEPVLHRFDIIVLEVNTSVSTRENTLKVIEGTPSSEPEEPDLVETSEIMQYAIVAVLVSAGVTEITESDLTDKRGTIWTPYVKHLWLPDAADDVKGIVELATTAEVDTGTDAERAITPDALDGSARSIKLDKVELKKVVAIAPFGSESNVTLGDGLIGIPIPAVFNGYNIVNITAHVHTKGITGTTDIQIRRRRAGTDVDVLTTPITIGDEWYASDETIDTANDDVATGDMLYVDVDDIHSGTAPLGLTVAVTLEKP